MLLTGSHCHQLLSLASGITQLICYAKGISRLLSTEANNSQHEVKCLCHNYHIIFDMLLKRSWCSCLSNCWQFTTTSRIDFDTKITKRLHYIKLYVFKSYILFKSTVQQSAKPHIFILGINFQSAFKTTTFLYIQD